MRHCQRCYTFTEGEVCATCMDATRDASRLCVVETPADQAAMERTAAFVACTSCSWGGCHRWTAWAARHWRAKLLERAGDGVVQR